MAGLNLGVLLALGVTLLGLVEFFCGFSSEAAGAGQSILLAATAGLLAAWRALPNGPKYLPVAAVISTVGAFDIILTVSNSAGDAPGIIVVLLIMGILQFLVAIAAALFDLGVIKLPAAGGQPQYGMPPQTGQFGAQPGQFGQQPPPAQPGQQTTYAPQQGQFGQQPPGTPPGGFGGQV